MHTSCCAHSMLSSDFGIWAQGFSLVSRSFGFSCSLLTCSMLLVARLLLLLNERCWRLRQLSGCALVCLSVSRTFHPRSVAPVVALTFML